MSSEQFLRFPSIDGLRAFEAAARLGSLERAAEQLCISASAVSKRISTLEELLGVSLLLRSTKPLTLTAAGKEYLPQLRAALELLAAIPLHRRAVQRVERLRIAAPPTFARQILVPALPGFTTAHPEIELELLLSTPFLDEAAPEAEVEIGNSLTSAGGSEGQVLMLGQVTPLLAPALLQRLEREGTPLREPADLCHAPLLRTPIEPWTPWLRAAGLDWPEPSHGTRFVDLGLTLEAAAWGQGIALGRPSLAAAWLGSGALLRPFALSVPAQKPYVLHLHAAESEGARAFAAWLAGCCAAAELAAGDRSA
ncbi:LysR family transcriptional regulator [Kinneretia asaccharophila]|uniref:LysR family transcriptional regulator n=1 Tax=Roseateles asaccharophilus TaxID=582607 RepID=A0A4R6MZN4_9BURK|nr:LysR family transcriptional regulator [Roseateles asaccharophilus]MDN3545492.1 LysR family transcriptional regulator [Roseateles asaccharophilus]TDP07872.1 LysR family transcriptional regulator [Roseateles asaccharophilus]